MHHKKILKKFRHKKWWGTILKQKVQWKTKPDTIFATKCTVNKKIWIIYIFKIQKRLKAIQNLKCGYKISFKFFFLLIFHLTCFKTFNWRALGMWQVASRFKLAWSGMWLVAFEYKLAWSLVRILKRTFVELQYGYL